MIDFFMLLQILLLVSIALNAVMIPVVTLVLTVGKPAWVYVLAKLKGKDLGIVLGKNGRMKILPTDYKSLEIAKTMAWLPKNPKYWNWGGVQT